MDRPFPVGTLLTVQAEYNGKTTDYTCTLLGYGRYGLQVSLPQLLNQTYTLAASSPILCFVTSTATKQLLMFKSYVMGYERTAPPCMVIAAPTTLESANRRQALRFATRISAAYVAEADEVYAESSETVDLSLTGVQLLTGRLVPKGAIMSVTLELPDQTIIVSGKVAWSSFRGRRAAAGVQFTRISASAQASLAKFLADLERQGRRPVS